MLLYTNKYTNPLIVRTRDQAVLPTLDIIVDVGGISDASTLRFDHHQNTFKDVWDPENEKIKDIKLSSAGLIYKQFGKEVIFNMTKHIFKQELTEK